MSVNRETPGIPGELADIIHGYTAYKLHSHHQPRNRAASLPSANYYITSPLLRNSNVKTFLFQSLFIYIQTGKHIY